MIDLVQNQSLSSGRLVRPAIPTSKHCHTNAMFEPHHVHSSDVWDIDIAATSDPVRPYYGYDSPEIDANLNSTDSENIQYISILHHTSKFRIALRCKKNTFSDTAKHRLFRWSKINSQWPTSRAVPWSGPTPTYLWRKPRQPRVAGRWAAMDWLRNAMASSAS